MATSNIGFDGAINPATGSCEAVRRQEAGNHAGYFLAAVLGRLDGRYPGVIATLGANEAQVDDRQSRAGGFADNDVIEYLLSDIS